MALQTVTNLADRAQVYLNDVAVGTWPQATVETWVVDAVRDYSQYFPRVIYDALADVGSSPDHYVELSDEFLEMIQVEFPTGSTPPNYLQRRSMHHPNFWEVDGYYDIVYTEQDATDPGGAIRALLMFSRQPVDDEGWAIRYLARHPADGAGDDVTVPEDHHQILMLFVVWQAVKERAATAIQDPDTTSDSLQKMVNAEMQAHEEYRRAINTAQQKRAQSGWSGPWRSDGFDPIY
jgi:hypothetical protein